MKKHIILFTCILLFLTSCTLKEPIENSYPIKLIVKSPAIRTSGTGFYKSGGDYTNLQLFYGSKMVINYESNMLSCLNALCMPKSTFNKNFLGYSHYGKIFDEILAGTPIYNSKNIIKSEFGFTQELQKKDAYSITYDVNQTDITFSDTKNDILIKLTKLGKQ
ncbi:MAG: hypothetical protein ACK5LP_05595 [Campylobacteraceae bacterium]